MSQSHQLHPSPSQQSPLLSRSTHRTSPSSHPLRHRASFTFNYCVAFLTVTTLVGVPLSLVRRHALRQPRAQPVHAPISPNHGHSSFVFAAIGDWGRHGLFRQTETADAMASILPSDTAMIVSLGDNFYSSGVLTVFDPQFQQTFEQVYNQPAILNLPWYLVLGNHDHYGSVRAQIEYSAFSQRWNMPARYYSRWLTPHLLIIYLDTSPLSNTFAGTIARDKTVVDPAIQLEWLRNQLNDAAPNSRFFIIGHHNMYSTSVADHQGDLSVRDAIEPILTPFAHRIIAYIAGHEHALMHMQPYAHPITQLNFDHFVTGAGSKLRPIVPPTVQRAAYWLQCCGVLAPSTNTSMPRTVWSKTANGFFLFRVDDDDTFFATAFDDNADLIYQYHRKLPPL